MRKYIPPVCSLEQDCNLYMAILTASTEDYEVDYVDPRF